MNTYPLAHLIINNLFVGSIESVNNEEYLRINNISAVLSLVSPINKFEGIDYLVFDEISDSPNQNILQYFGKCFSFIDKYLLQNKNIIVNCHAGISRSSTIVIGYLMYKNGLSLGSAYSIVKQRRGIINPNYGFIDQLGIFNNWCPNFRREWCRLMSNLV